MLDFFNISALLTSQQRQIQTTLREFLEVEASPHIRDWWVQGNFPTHLARKFGEMGLIGGNIATLGDPLGLDGVEAGLIMYEMERVDSGLRSFISVQGALVMYAIDTYGSEEQKKCYLPKLACGKLIGCFGLTEPETGSDVASIKTRATWNGKHYLLNGVKTWISCGPFAKIAIIWAKDDDEVVRGFIVPTDVAGFTVNSIERRMSLRVGGVAELVLDNVSLKKEAELPSAIGLAAPLSCLTEARYGLVWGSMGSLEAVYLEALEFAKSRWTFGKPIASRQLVQAKLVKMISDHTAGMLLAWRLGKLKIEGQLTHSQVSLAKRNNVRAALNGARSARDILGANGITLDHQVMRHMLNLESVDTYEGTYDIQTLIVGREITGMEAFR